jgi:hypothetical protein
MVPEREDDEGGAEPAIEDKAEGVTVDPADDTPSDKPNETPEQRQSRKERRANRMREEQEKARAAEERYSNLERQFQEQSRQLAETRGYVNALGQRQQGDPEVARKAKIDSLSDEADRHLQNAGLAAKAGDQARARAEMRAYEAKQREIYRVEDEPNRAAELDRRMGEFRSQQPLQMTPQLIAMREEFNSKFPWLKTNRKARAAVDFEISQELQAGRPFTVEMAIAKAAEVEKEFNLKRAPGPATERQRAAFSAPGGGEAGGADDGDGPITVKMGKAEKIMAHKLYPHLDATEAEKKWAKDVGAPEARRQARSGR